MRMHHELHGWMILILLVFLFTVNVTAGQSDIQTQGSKPCEVSPVRLRGYNWWNYYERGSEYANGRCWHQAIADFKAAIAQRAGDKHHARTYGLHFVDYFPHRSLGIAYYHLGRYLDAIAELEISLKTAKTKEAERYRNKARNLSGDNFHTSYPITTQIILNGFPVKFASIGIATKPRQYELC